jgi:glycerol-3-phosphate dehydrogenase (NAD(P)+)
LAEVTVIGAGAWGTAFAIHLARMGHSIRLWVFEPELVEILETKRENLPYLPGFILSSKLHFTASLDKAAAFSDSVVVAVPSFALRKTLSAAVDSLSRKRLLILTKGLERETLFPMSRVAQEVCGPSAGIAVLSGPSFAREVAEGSFTSVVISSADSELAAHFQRISHNDFFRVYTTDDIAGVELGGAMKNVMAIGAGIIEGLGLGTNAQAAFLTRALAEIKRLGKTLGARELTFMGLSGMGDLILTSYGKLSRNRLFGIELAKGRKPADILSSQNTVVEGYYTISAAYRFSKKAGIEMPITEELYRVVHEGKDLRLSLNDITRRDFKVEDA